MYKEIFIYPTFIAFILLIIHSILFRGSKKTITFFGLAFIFGLIREWYYKNFVKGYTFTDLTTFTLIGVPIAIPIGWTFTFYIGLFFSQKILNFNIDLEDVPERHAEEIYKRKVLPIILLASIFSTTVSFAIETCAINMGWWEFSHIDSYYAPISVLFGWFTTSLIFFHLYLLVQYKQLRLPKIYILIANLIVLNLFQESFQKTTYSFKQSDFIILIISIILISALFFYYADLSKLMIFLSIYFAFAIFVFNLYVSKVIDESTLHILEKPGFFSGLFIFCLFFIRKYRTNERINILLGKY
ncbi:MAG: hypothetical protein ACTSPD_20945 [Promethearchaeota archaeon]